MISQQRSREAENERQWKQLQAMRQQQAQAAQQQQVMQDQRSQGFKINYSINNYLLFLSIKR